VEFEIILAVVKNDDITSTPINLLKSFHPYHVKDVYSDKAGYALQVRNGIDNATGDFITFFMADGSDHSKDTVALCKALEPGVDCVFGSRFCKKNLIEDYPKFKLLLNRVGNIFLHRLFGDKFDDLTESMKIYRTSVLSRVYPHSASSFDLNLEMGLRAIKSNLVIKQIPVHWSNRVSGKSKFKLFKECWQYFTVACNVWRSFS
jgi:dolichol-phosphate mannosyltransferase